MPLRLSCPIRLLPLIPIISARTNYESIYNDSPVSWKVMTFARVISEWAGCGDANSTDPIHVISIGDSSQEREAIFRVHKHHRVRYIPKSIKFPEHLTIEELISQHHHLSRHIESIINQGEMVDVALSRSGEVTHLNSQASQVVPIKNLELETRLSYMRPQSVESSTSRRTIRRTTFPRRRPRSRVPEFLPPPSRVSLLVRAASSPRM